MKRRVVVTGLGAVTPLGNDVDSFWSGIRAGEVGIGQITKFDTTDFKVKIAAEVKDFVARDRMDFKSAKRMELFSQYAVVAAGEAMENAGIDMSQEDPFRVGVIVGSGIGSLQSMEREEQRMLDKGPSRVDPLLVPLLRIWPPGMSPSLQGPEENVPMWSQPALPEPIVSVMHSGQFSMEMRMS